MTTADLARVCAEAIQAQVGRADTRTSLLDQIAGIVQGALNRAVEEERERIRGSEVLPLVRQLVDIGDLAEQTLAERRWVFRVGTILSHVRGCKLVWPDLFDAARVDDLEAGL